MLLVGLSSAAYAAFIYCGASELFCLSKERNHYRQQYPHRRESARRSRKTLGAGEDETDENFNDGMSVRLFNVILKLSLIKGEDGEESIETDINPSQGKSHSKSRKMQLSDGGSSVKSSGAKSRKKSKSVKSPHFGTLPSSSKPKGDKNGTFGSSGSKRSKGVKERGKRSRLSRGS